MRLVKRYDYEPNVSAQPEMTREGFLKVMARATRVGVLKYKQADGTVIRELRHPDEVFSKDSMESLAMKPVTNNHPKSLIDSETASMYQVGSTGETVKIDGKYLEVMTVITDKRTIEDAEGGKVEVSPGYTCELDFTPGVYDGEEYDAVQKNIRYNHLAIVKKGRSGPEVRLRLDSEDAIQTDLNQSKEKKTMKVKLKDKDFDVDEDLGEAIMDALKNAARPVAEEMDAMKAAAVKSKTDAEEAAKELEKTQARADGLQAEIEKLKKERTDSAEKVDVRAAVKARIELDKVAQAAGVEKFDEMDDLEVKKAVIIAHAPEVKLDGKSEEYINARFDVAAESITASDEKAQNLGKTIAEGNGRKPAEVMDADDSRQKMIERQKNQWKKPEGKEE